ncbi:MAG: hypothetical protein KC474_00265 [Cyanobacteria bacterium HKST-UBA04]|nr:hypothetical protein [Cyanobacteria bacterium HKST-UBA04]
MRLSAILPEVSPAFPVLARQSAPNASGALRFSGIGVDLFKQQMTPQADTPPQITWLLREPEVMLPLALLIKARFPQGVPILSIGASDFSEPWSLRHVLNLTDKAFGQPPSAGRYPIEGIELSPYRVAIAQAGYIELEQRPKNELGSANDALRQFASDLMVPNRDDWSMDSVFVPYDGGGSSVPAVAAEALLPNGVVPMQDGFAWHQVDAALRDSVRYTRGSLEIFASKNNTPAQQRVVLLRNVFPYIKDRLANGGQTLLDLVGQQLAPGSLLVVGMMDKETDAEGKRHLIQRGLQDFLDVYGNNPVAHLVAGMMAHSKAYSSLFFDINPMLEHAGFKPLAKDQLAPFLGTAAEGRIWVKKEVP